MLFRSDRKSTRLNSSHTIISYAVFCLKKKKSNLRGTTHDCGYGRQHRSTTGPAPPPPPPSRPPPLPYAVGRPRFTLDVFFFLNDPAPPEIYPLPLPDALPIFPPRRRAAAPRPPSHQFPRRRARARH